MVVEVKEHDQYLVKMDGSGRLTVRNKKILQPYSPYLRHRTYRVTTTGYGKADT